jgi:hypothetical protein
LLVAQFAKSLVIASVILHPTAVGAAINDSCPKLISLGAVSSIAQEDAE